MNRREFVAMPAALALATQESKSPPPISARECYDLQHYTFTTAEQMQRFTGFLTNAWLPAVRRLRGTIAGAFVVADKPDALSVYKISSGSNIGRCAEVEAAIREDKEYLAAGAAVLGLPATDPPYAHLESSLMLAFSSWPKLKTPKQAAAGEPRVFELRTYESHSKRANLKKIEMFDAGEAAMFARAGMQPVFFGETISGPQVPNLTYMLTYPDIESRGKFWKTWSDDPEKARLFAIPEYNDKLIVSKIHSTYLRPLAGSMI